MHYHSISLQFIATLFLLSGLSSANSQGEQSQSLVRDFKSNNMATVSFLKMSKRACHSCKNDKDSSPSLLPSVGLPKTLPVSHNDCKSHSPGSKHQSAPIVLSELDETLEELQQNTVKAAAGIKPAASSPCGSCDSKSSSHAPPHEDGNNESVVPAQDEVPTQDEASTQDEAPAQVEAPVQDEAWYDR